MTHLTLVLLFCLPLSASAQIACGDCDGNAVVSILDTLLAAQHAAGVLTIGSPEFGACNVAGTSGGPMVPGAVVDILDGLRIAQSAVGIPVTLDCNTDPTCVVVSPVGGVFGGDVVVDFDALDGEIDPLDITFEVDAGAGFGVATAAMSSTLPSPATGVTPGAGLQFTWDSATDVLGTAVGAVFRITVDDGRGGSSSCSTTVDVSNPAAPVCSINAPSMTPEFDDVSIDFDATDGNMDPLTITFEYDAGAGFVLATAGATSPITGNPAMGVTPAPGLSFVWDSWADAPWTNVPGLTFRITVDDGGLPPTTCTTVFDLLNIRLDMMPPAIPGGIVGQPYQATLTPTGGSGSGYVFSQAAGTLPPGVMLDPMGSISGTPTQNGGFHFRVMLTDSAMITVEREYHIVVEVVETYVAYAADEVTDNLREVRLVDITAAGPPAPFSAVPMPTPNGDVDISQAVISKSPDGRYLAFAADLTLAGSHDLYVVDLLAMSPVAVNVTNMTGVRDVEHFEWSPDGLKIAVTGDFAAPNDDCLAIVDLTAGLAGVTLNVVVTPVAQGDVLPFMASSREDDLAWSLDSTKVYFRGDVLTDTVMEGFVYDLGNPMAGAQRLHPPAVPGGNVLVMHAVGSDIALFVGDLDVDAEFNLYAVDTSGGMIGSPVRMNPIAVGGDVGRDTFDVRPSPGGRFAAFVGDLQFPGSDDTWLVDFRAGIPAPDSAQPLTNHGDSALDAGFDALYWSPQGDRLVFLADAQVNGVEQAFFVDLRGLMPAATVSISPPPTTFEDTDELRWAPDGRGVALEGSYGAPNVEHIYYVDLNGVSPGPIVQLSRPGTSSSDVEGDMVWLPDSSGVVFRHDKVRSNLVEIWLGAPAMPMTAIRLNAPFPADAGFNGCGFGSPNDFIVSQSGDRVFGIAEAYVDNQRELLSIDIVGGPNMRRLNGPLATNGDCDTVARHTNATR